MATTIFKLDSEQFARVDMHLGAMVNALWEINDKLRPLDNAIDNNTTETTKWLALIKESTDAGFDKVAEAIANSNPLPPPQPHQVEVKFMFVVKDDHADVNFSLVLGDVTDAEGNAIPDAQLALNVSSTDEAVVAVTFDAASKSGSVHFGAPGTATVTATVATGETLLGSGAADFTVTVGDPAAITSVNLSFDGLTES